MAQILYKTKGVKMKTKFFSIATMLMVLMLVAACAPQAEFPTEPDPLEDLGTLSQSLRETGATIESDEMISQPFFSVEGRILKVNGADVQVFEYKSVEEMETEAALVSADGSSVSTSMVSWMATPHFFKSGRVLVLYVGDDAAILDLLTDALGGQFAGR
jgi:hypothetical protein